MTSIEHPAPEPEPDPNPSVGVEVGTDEVTVSLSDERLSQSGLESLHPWASIVFETAIAEGVEAGTIDVLLVDEEAMTELNIEHMDGTGSTDVLSFPLDDEDDEFDLDLPGIQRHLGDIVLCPAVAERQAPEHCGTAEHEITLLLVHGVLHLLGHDHAEPDETAAMRDRERVNIERYGVVHPSL